MNYLDLINNGLLDAEFPYPLAFETAYNMGNNLLDLANVLIELFVKFINLSWGIILLLLIVLLTRIFFRIMK